MSIFEVKNLYFKYDKHDKGAPYVLNDISFNVEKKDFIALIGKSGSGKSTLVNHLNGLLKADKGDILYNGESIYGENFDLTSLRFKCGVVFQHPEYQLFSETVIEDVAFGAIKMGLSKEEANEKALLVLKELDIEYLKDEMPFNLSGGEKRKVAFAGVFVMEPEVLIFDEPDAGLDSSTKRKFYSFIKELNEKNDKTIIFITHNLDDVIEYANKVIVLEDGHKAKEGKPYDILMDNKLMSECRLIPPYAVDIYKYLADKNINIDKEKLKTDDIIVELEKVMK